MGVTQEALPEAMTLELDLPAPSRAALYRGVSWAEFLDLLRELDHRPGIRLAFDRGTLEIMSPSRDHEHVNDLLRCLVSTLCDELGIPRAGLGSTTWRRDDLLRAIEPDNCYYLEHEPIVRGKEIDLTRDPPPDLGIEIDVTRKSLERFPIYAALGIPELWRFSGKTEKLAFNRLDTAREYEEVPRSLAFPFLTPPDLERFLELRHTLDDTTIVKRFREWVRSRGENRHDGSL